MAESIPLVGHVEHEVKVQYLWVLAVMMSGKHSNYGLRVTDIPLIPFGGGAIKPEDVLNELEFNGFVVSSLRQTGTAGTCSRFYNLAPGFSVKVHGPPLVKK